MSKVTMGTTTAPSKSNFKKVRTRMLEENQYNRIKNTLFCQPEEADDVNFYLNFHPSGHIGYEGYDFGFDIPQWMPMTFRPTLQVNLNSICVYLAAYIFIRDDEKIYGNQVLVKTTSNVFGDSTTLKSLMPYCPIDQEQYLMDGQYSADYVREIYQVNFMTTKSFVSKIFIPMNDQGNHWYLLVVDFIERKLIWLDPLPDVDRHHMRRHQILKMTLFLEEIMLHDFFGELCPYYLDNLVTNFWIVQPRFLSKQRTES
ncbi:unnamed protein product [Lathyrus sativus]|nr:unnamed protein product [Lathyrus sativus]